MPFERRWSAVLLGIALATTGCVRTAMLPAQQLDPGTTVPAVTIDEPGILYLPRGTVQVTHGVGGGDLTVNVSGLPVGGGLTGRYYLHRGATAEFQVQGATFSSWTLLALMGIQEVPRGDDSWYVGGQVGAINGRGNQISDVGPTDRRTYPVVGGSIGYAPISIGEQWTMQIEVDGNVPLSGSGSDPPLPATRLSVGFFRLFD